MLNRIVNVAIGILVLSALMPIAINSIISVDTTGWNSAVVVLFGTVLPLLGVLSAALLFIKYGRGKGD